jgi:hypothetical protein
MNAKEIIQIENRKEQIKMEQRKLFLKYGVSKYFLNEPSKLSYALRQMLECRHLNDDYDTFIELEKDYVECNGKLIEIGININKLHEQNMRS